MSDDRFTEEQRQYLQGFVAGADLARSVSRLPTFSQTLARNGVLPQPAVTKIAANKTARQTAVPAGAEAESRGSSRNRHPPSNIAMIKFLLGSRPGCSGGR